MAEAASALSIENSLKKMLCLGHLVNNDIESSFSSAQITEQRKPVKKAEYSLMPSHIVKSSSVQDSEGHTAISRKFANRIVNHSSQGKRKNKKKNNEKTKPKVQTSADSLNCENEIYEHAITCSADSTFTPKLRNIDKSEIVNSIQVIKASRVNNSRINVSPGLVMFLICNSIIFVL